MIEVPLYNGKYLQHEFLDWSDQASDFSRSGLESDGQQLLYFLPNSHFGFPAGAAPAPRQAQLGLSALSAGNHHQWKTRATHFVSTTSTITTSTTTTTTTSRTKHKLASDMHQPVHTGAWYGLHRY